MPGAIPLYLTDANGVVWLITVAPSGNLRKTPASPPLSAPSFVLLNDLQSGQTWSLSILANGDIGQSPAPPGQTTTVNQIPLTSPSGALWFIQITNGALQTIAGSYPCNTPISTLALNVLTRLEENYPPSGPIFWDLATEIYSGIVEGMNDLLLLVGRPTQAVTQSITLTPNTVWQSVPKGIFLLSNLYGPQGDIRQATLADMDYAQASWQSSWEQDTSEYPLRWGAVGFNFFFVHPAPLTPIQLTFTGIQYPVLDGWPYSGAELVPFRHEFFCAIEMYAAHYASLKEGGREAEEGLGLYRQYLELAQRMSVLEDVRDPVIFAKDLGAPNPVALASKR